MGSKMKKILACCCGIALMASLAGCGGAKDKAGNAPAQEKKLVIYTARENPVTELVIPKFKQKYPDYDVQVMTMGAQQILERVRAEKNNPQADFWWGGTQAALMTAAKEGLLEAYKPTFADKIPAMYKDSQDRWYGEMLLPEVIMYNDKALKKEDLPKDWDDLLDPKYKGQIIIRGVLPSGTMRTIYSAMIYRQDPNNPQKGYDWLAKLDANTKEYATDPATLYIKLTREEGKLSLWNLQDVLLQREKHGRPLNFALPASGVPILVDGVGIIKGAKHSEAAKKFYEFLFDEQLQIELAHKTYQIPTRTDISKDKMPDWYKGLNLKPLNIDWLVLAEKEKEWMQYWDQNIKGKGAK
ncbi:extracellular solute-binding protein [Sporolituus thermophilus]|uniref:Iron(III) transport system substrate-binding protein n=1 Tax=Sporolituus thermophilus DSM 23256 TaxID=1123285 RepID=A0A1G7IML1_9FIRM|nr:extracellular solute-binding protein [Sporolituus thermophilus]SDF13766.1 iron(III) transport system substrate-binding protein [Sporolituus thermophilus DSM 23256]